MTATPALQDGRYLLLAALGRGGMAAVYRAFDRVGQRLVALKVPSVPEPPGPGHSLSVEFAAWSRLAHPNVVRLYELSWARSGPFPPGEPYLVLEHVAGGPAHRALPAGRSGPARVEALVTEVLRALEHVHGAGLLHRDLKPSNVLLPAGRGPAKLTDFGLAAPLGTREEPGRINGSLPYVSPEALLGQTLDGRSDLYSLGILLYQLVTGRLPLPGAGPEALVRWHLSGPPPDPRAVRPETPERLARFILRLTARSPAARPADA
ncbi:MAG TPA: serine/threonine-protein kinase, partial [Candidatus Polarisedimenticolaceae bacterium]|nr:serine/threonine-protein kinase [Candidatus Polarisedimenticolaceae bacterium]